MEFAGALCYCEQVTAMPFGERLRAIREGRLIRSGRPLTLREVSERSGISAPHLSQIETGKRWFGRLPPLDDLQRMAGALGVSVGQLIGSDDAGLEAPRPHQLTDAELETRFGVMPYSSIPFIEDVLASAGPGSGVPQDIEETLPRRTRRKRYEHLREVTVEGRCMEPDLLPGDIVIVDRRQMPQPGKIVVALRDEAELLIKRLVVKGEAQELNSNDGQVIPLDERVRILGPVVAFQRRLF